jgi:hypothetical protein
MKFENYLNAIVVLIGFFTLLAWTFNPALFWVFGPMNPVTAICLLLNVCSISFDANNKNKILLHLVIFTAATVLYDFCFSEHLELDKIIFTDKLGTNRMAPSTAIGLIFIAFGRLNAPAVFPVFSYSTLVFTFLAIVAKITFFAVSYFTPMSYLTAVSFVLLSVSQILRWKNYNQICNLVERKI